VKTIRQLGLRWLLPPVLTIVSGLLFWYGMVQDQIARAELAGSPWLRELQPNPIMGFAGVLNLPEVIVGLILKNWLPERVLEVIVCLLVPVQWWLVGIWADCELGLGRFQNQRRPPLGERTLTLTCGVLVLLLLAALLVRRFDARFPGLFWMLLIPMSFLTMVVSWLRRYWRPAGPRR